MAAAASVPLPLIDKVIALVQTKPLLTGNDIGPDELRDLLAFAASYGPVPDELEAFAGGLRHTITAALNKAGSAALTVYEVAKRQSKRSESVDRRPHVEDMKRLLNARFPGVRRKARGKAPSPSPSPSPAEGVRLRRHGRGLDGTVVVTPVSP